jgi:hypothetical protein
VDRVVDELALKSDFNKHVQDILSPEQQAALASDSTRDLAGLDPLSPSNMVPLRAGHNDVAAQSEQLAAMLLMDRVAADLGVARESLVGYEYVFETWVRDSAPAPGATSTLPGTMSTQELIQAGMAQAAAYRTLQQVAPQNTQLHQAVQSSTTVFVPRIVPPPVVQPWIDPDMAGVVEGEVSPEPGEELPVNDDGTIPGEIVYPAPVEEMSPPVEQVAPPTHDSTQTPYESHAPFAASRNEDDQRVAESRESTARESDRREAHSTPPLLEEQGEPISPWKYLLQD